MKRSMLILDDEQEIAEILGVILEDHFQCSIYSRPDEALQSLASQSYDFIITDLEMPIMHGVQFIEAAKRLSPECKVFISTGHDDYHPKVVAAIAAGAKGIVAKPFQDVEEMMRILEGS